MQGALVSGSPLEWTEQQTANNTLTCLVSEYIYNSNQSWLWIWRFVAISAIIKQGSSHCQYTSK